MMKKRWFRRGEKGVAAVEFALVLPLFVTMLFAIMDFGWYFFHVLIVTSAAREGTRAAVQSLPFSGTISQANINTAIDQGRVAAETYVKNNVANASVTATVQSITIPSTTVKAFEATVTINPFKPLIGFVPLPNSLNPIPKTITAKSTAAQ
jgi:Flp pilus assembly protein TadG